MDIPISNIRSPICDHVSPIEEGTNSKSPFVLRSTNYNIHVRNYQQHKTARMLIIVSTVFVTLKLPTWIFKIYGFVINSMNDQYDPSLISIHSPYVHKLCQLVYHLNFAINFFIYSLCGWQFRKGLSLMCTRMQRRFRKLTSRCGNKKEERKLQLG